VTGRSFCDFVVWTKEEIHIERITLDEALIKSALPVAEKFYRFCILPELLGKWYTRQQTPRNSVQSPRDPALQTEEDDGSWCHCKERKGGDMVGCDNKSCTTTWFHLECVELSAVPRGKWFCPTCRTNMTKNTRKRKCTL